MASVRGDTAATPGEQREAALLVCMFHLNLAFSSLAPERQAHVVQACYWPMLRLAEETPFPIAFEATGWTLERIAEHDPAWIARARELIDAGRVELIGSGYAQCAAPLLPAEVNRWNLRLGFEAYERAARDAPGARARLRAGLLARPRADLRRGRRRGDDRRLGQRLPLQPRLGRRRAPPAAARAGQRRRQPAGRVERVDRVSEVPALRPRRAVARALRRVHRRGRRRGPRCAHALRQRRRGLRPPPGPLRGRADARRGRVGTRRARAADARRARGRHAGAAARGARPARPAGGRAGAAPRGARPADPGQEAGQVQHHALGRQRPRRRRDQHALPAHLRAVARRRGRGSRAVAAPLRAVGLGLPHAHRRCALGRDGAPARAGRGRCRRDRAGSGTGAGRAGRAGGARGRRPGAARRRDARRPPVARAQRPSRGHAQRPARPRDRGLQRRPHRPRDAVRHARARLLSDDRARRRLVHRRRRAGGAAAPQGDRPRADGAGLRGARAAASSAPSGG